MTASLYTAYFGLAQPPFSIAPDPRMLYMSERHREALAHLLYGIDGGGGFVVLTGAIGAGKTTVCRCFLEQVPRTSRVAYIFNPKLTVAELLQTICDEFHIAVPPRAGIKAHVDLLNTFLLARHAAGESCVLIIDEAQMLAAEVLEQLRLLTNLETAERKLLQIILIGQPELRTLLASPKLEQLAQRVIARYHLEPLSPHEVGQYIQHRLAIAGWQGPALFDAKAVAAIAEISRGVPRRINLLADRALLGTYAKGLRQVDEDTARRAAAEVLGRAAPPQRRPETQRWALGVAWAVLAAVLAWGAWRAWQAWQAWGSAGPGAAASPVAASAAKARGASAALSASAASATSEAASAPPVAAAPAVAAQLLPDAHAAAVLLAGLWGSVVDGERPACEQLTARGLRCFDGEGADLLQRLGRPALVRLYEDAPGGASGWAVVRAWAPDQVTLMGAGGALAPWPAARFARAWDGRFTTLWQAAPEQPDVLRAGAADAAVAALHTALQTWEGAAATPAPAVLDAGLRARVRAFQTAQGLRADGLAGPTTWMLLARATGTGEPRLNP